MDSAMRMAMLKQLATTGAAVGCCASGTNCESDSDSDWSDYSDVGDISVAIDGAFPDVAIKNASVVLQSYMDELTATGATVPAAVTAAMGFLSGKLEVDPVP